MNSQSWKRLFTPNIRSKPDNKISILGNKTIIRPKKRKDIENDFQWRTDTELSDLDATVPINLSYEQFERISVNELSKSSQWSEKFSIENHEKKHIGNCMYYDVNRWEKSCEFGIMIGDKSFWNGGYGTDATINLLYYIYTETEIENVFLHTLQTNIRAQKAFSKSGFSSPKEVKKGRYEFFKMTTNKEDWLKKFSEVDIKIIPEEEKD
jgi:RimJ/RimL family protein N-acetyltransferase|tara:strand:- start:461 stop:1087 length:627 start_codon:yes stop_codon:yes gene_type:complete